MPCGDGRAGQRDAADTQHTTESGSIRIKGRAAPGLARVSSPRCGPRRLPIRSMGASNLPLDQAPPPDGYHALDQRRAIELLLRS